MKAAAVLLVCFAAIAPAGASTFNISPIRANLDAAHRTEALTIMNADDAPVVVQVHIVSWSQQDGAELNAETREMLVTPPVLQIPANGQQIVRVALRREPDRTKELSYRVIFEEVPQAAPANFNGLRVALRLSIPIFIAPMQGKPASQVTWESKWLANGQVEIAAVNHGTGHLQITDFEAQFDGAPALHGATSKYVLAGCRMSWTLTAPAAANRRGALPIRGHSDQGDFSADAAPSDL